MPGSVAVVAVGVITIWLFPVVIDPLFNKFEPLPRGQLRSQVLELAREADVDVGQVYRVDASRRTTGVNAYVNGLGHSKRVVLYDNLIDGLPRDQVLQVVAHELGHQHHRDLLRGLALARARGAGRDAAGAARWPSGSGAATASATRTPARARPSCRPWCSRWRSCRSGSGSRATSCREPVEASADEFSLDLTRQPGGPHRARARDRRAQRVGPGPAAACTHVLFGTHPTTLERIGIGEAWAQRA